MKQFLRKFIIYVVMTTIALPAGLLASLATASHAKAAVFGSYDFNSNSGVSVQPTHADFSDFSRHGVTYENSPSNVYNSSNWALTDEVNRNKYISFSVTADSGYSLNLDTLRFIQNGSENAPEHLLVSSSSDNFSTISDIKSADVTENDDEVNIGLSVVKKQSVEFRFYVYGDKSVHDKRKEPSSHGTWRVDNVEVSGFVQADKPIDTTRPTITLLGENPVTITQGTSYTDAGATATDNVDGNLTDNIVMDDGGLDTAVVGTYTITYNVSDAAGNAADQISRTVRVVAGSIAAPSNLSPEDGIVVKSTNLGMITWSSVSNGNEPTSYTYESSHSNAVGEDGSFSSHIYFRDGLTSPEINASGTAEGTYYWHVRAQDSLGHKSAWSDAWLITVDNTAPNSPVFDAMTIRVNADSELVTGTGEPGATITLTDEDGQSFTGIVGVDGRFQVLVNLVEDQVNTFTATAIDEAGNISSPPVTIKITEDSQAPVDPKISINSCAKYTISKVVNLNLEAKDDFVPISMMISNNSDLSADGVNADSGKWISFEASKGWELNTGDGTKVVYAKFKDGGNSETSIVAGTIILDTISPSLPLDVEAAANGSTVDINWQASDDANDIAGYNIKRSDNPAINLNDSLIVGTDYSDKNVADGTYSYFIEAVDRAGNVSNTGISNHVTVDTFIPAAPLIISVTNQDKMVTINWQIVPRGIGYNVYLSANSNLLGTLTNSQPLLVTNTNVNVSAYGTYYVRVIAVADNGAETSPSEAIANGKSITINAPVVTTTVAPVVNETPQQPPVVGPQVAPAPAHASSGSSSSQEEISSSSSSSDDQGEIKGEQDKDGKEPINWTPWIILFILILLAGAATGGYFYWFAKDEEEEEKEKKIDKNIGKKAAVIVRNKKKAKRW